MSKKVLVITYHFPPQPRIASVRLGGLAKYLPANGWEPVILTVKLPPGERMATRVIETEYTDVLEHWRRILGFNSNGSIVEQLGYDYENGVHSSSSWGTAKQRLVQWTVDKFKDVIFYPDEQKGWYSHAVAMADKVLGQEKFDAIISSSRPETSHLIASYINKKYRIPWVADFRDLWTQNHYRSCGLVRNAVEKRLELSTMSSADALVTVSEPLATKLGELHNKPAISIPNGFDPGLWNNQPEKLTEKFTITYTGSIYEGKRDPAPLLETIYKMIGRRLISPDNTEVRFFGPERVGQWLQPRVRQYGLENVVKFFGIVPRAEALSRQRESQMLLLLNWNNPAETGVYTGKVFEYLSARRPIIAIGSTGGVINELLSRTGAGVCAADEEELEKILLASYRQYLDSGAVTYGGDEKEIMKYSHVEMAVRFAEVLNKVVCG